MKIMPNSDQMIGKSLDRFKCLEHYGFDWRSFYNGWLEGRADVIYAFNTGKCDFIVDDTRYNEAVQNIDYTHKEKRTIYGWIRVPGKKGGLNAYKRVKRGVL